MQVQEVMVEVVQAVVLMEVTPLKFIDPTGNQAGAKGGGNGGGKVALYGSETPFIGVVRTLQARAGWDMYPLGDSKGLAWMPQGDVGGAGSTSSSYVVFSPGYSGGGELWSGFGGTSASEGGGYASAGGYGGGGAGGNANANGGGNPLRTKNNNDNYNRAASYSYNVSVKGGGVGVIGVQRPPINIPFVGALIATATISWDIGWELGMNTEFYADRIAQFLVTFGVSAELLYGPSYDSFASEHTKGARPSTKGKHERGQARKARDRGGEKADQNRRFPNKKPGGWKGPWPPK